MNEEMKEILIEMVEPLVGIGVGVTILQLLGRTVNWERVAKDVRNGVNRKHVSQDVRHYENPKVIDIKKRA